MISPSVAPYDLVDMILTNLISQHVQRLNCLTQWIVNWPHHIFVNISPGSLFHKLEFPLLYKLLILNTKCTKPVYKLLNVNHVIPTSVCKWNLELAPYSTERSRPTKGQNRPNKMGKIELKFWQIIFYMKDRAYIMVYEDGNFFFPLCPRSQVPNIAKSKNLVKIAIFLLWNSQISHEAQPCSKCIIILVLK
jgi:hypothetical protein